MYEALPKKSIICFTLARWTTNSSDSVEFKGGCEVVGTCLWNSAALDDGVRVALSFCRLEVGVLTGGDCVDPPTLAAVTVCVDTDRLLANSSLTRREPLKALGSARTECFRYAYA